MEIILKILFKKHVKQYQRFAPTASFHLFIITRNCIYDYLLSQFFIINQKLSAAKLFGNGKFYTNCIPIEQIKHEESR